MNAAFFIIGALLGYVIAILVRRWMRKRPYFALMEFWAYLPNEKMPNQDELMTLVTTGDVIGPQEALLFSDVRLHLALVLRAKNPHVFRPDLFESHIEPSAEILEALAESPALVKIRFVSEQPLKDDRHLRLLPYLAYGVLKLSGGRVLYDVAAERLYTTDDWLSLIKADRRLEQPDSHARAIWKQEGVLVQAETRGLVKRGMPELVAQGVDRDEKILVLSVMEEAVRSLWSMGQLPERLDVETFGDRFRLEFHVPKKGHALVRILRVRTV